MAGVQKVSTVTWVLFSQLALGLREATVSRMVCPQRPLIVEGVVADLLHVIPAGDDAEPDGVFQGQDASLALAFISHIVVLAHAQHDVLGTPRLEGAKLPL
ncbi:hypothetical protein H920_09916 [Fukomys damarensis]|uniref:Secreted protein n=1 Tax=Fukomys damarensis TaxID=885580 RepID=A0A091E0Y6_FUKDA|nr:hypothetical protein H920_09916 [Fukomys damarensis]